MNCIEAPEQPSREGLMAIAELRSAHREWYELLAGHAVFGHGGPHPAAGCPADELQDPCPECTAIKEAREAFFAVSAAGFQSSKLDRPITAAGRRLRHYFFERLHTEDEAWRQQQGWQP